MDSTVASNALFSMPAFQMIGKKAAKEKFAILLVGPANLCASLKDEILNVNHENHYYQMNIHMCELVEDVIKSSQQCHADYIAFLIDPSDNSAVEMVERSISVLGPLYLCSRLCLINCYDVTPLETDAEQIHNLVDKFSVLIMHGDLANAGARNFLAQRIIYLSSSVCGFKTGLPLVFDLPSSKIVSS